MTRWICSDSELAHLVRRGIIKDDNIVKQYALHVPEKQDVNKYRNDKVCIDGHMFDSKAEAREYERLKLLKMAGEIKSIELQPKFLLQPSYKRVGKTIRAVHYIADFKVVYADGTEQVIDVKSEITEKNQVYRLKRKLLLYKYPQINFVEVW